MCLSLSVDACSEALAEWTGLEPATPGVTGRYSNQLNYHSVFQSCRISREAYYTELFQSVKKFF